MRDSHYLRWFPRAMHREVELVGGTYALQESSEAYGREFAPKNEVLTMKTRCRGRDLLQLLRLNLVRPVTRNVCVMTTMAQGINGPTGVTEN